MRSEATQDKQYKDIGQRIRLFRERAGMSQEELGKRIGRHSASAVYYIEQGERRLKVIDLVEIAKALGVSVDALMGAEAHKVGWSYQGVESLPRLSTPVANPITPAYSS